MPNPSDEVKAKLDIVEVIREYIPLKAAGLNFRANCPFHREKTPSFMVSPEKQIWHCFGCGKGGDAFSFVMEMEGLSFIEALRLLAKKAGVVLKKADPALTSKRNVLLDLVELAAKFYHKILLDSPSAAAARAYLKDRALSEGTIEAWQIGYSPQAWETLINFLKSRGYGENEIFLAGLAVKRSEIGVGDGQTNKKYSGFYDRFRGRIMFPLSDVAGNLVGFSARILPAPAGTPRNEMEEKMGKYINTPATMIYDKSKILFGMDKAKMSIKAEDAAILVEGQMDVITAHQSGFKNVVASSGTALTGGDKDRISKDLKEQVFVLKRYTNNLYLCFDMDKAGEMASERGIAQAMQAEMNIKVIELPEGKDLDEFIKKNPSGWPQAVMAAKPMMRYFFDKIFARFDKQEYEGQRQIIKKLLPLISKFGSKIEQDFWLKRLGQEIDAKENYLREKLEEITAGNQAISGKKTVPIDQKKPPLDLKSSREEKLSELLLALALRFPSHLEYVMAHSSPDDFVGFLPINPPPLTYSDKSEIAINKIRPNHETGREQAGIDFKTFYKNLIIYYNKLIDSWSQEGGNFDLSINYHDLRNWFNDPENFTADIQNDHETKNKESYGRASLLDRLVLLADKEFYNYTEEQAKVEIISLVAYLRISSLTRERQRIIKQIALTEKETVNSEEKTERLTKLMEEYKAINEEIKLLNPNVQEII